MIDKEQVEIYYDSLEYCLLKKDAVRGLKVLRALRDELLGCAEQEEAKPTIKPKKKKKANSIPSWGQIRKQILNRDDYNCRVCAKDYELHVHHIDYDRSNNCESNLVTLCGSCHRALHRENYKPIEHDVPPPWDKEARAEYDEMNFYN